MENTNETNNVSWHVPALIFAKTLGLILEENQGIADNLDTNTKIAGHEDVEQVIVYKKNNEIHIAPSEETLEEGTALNLNITEN